MSEKQAFKNIHVVRVYLFIGLSMLLTCKLIALNDSSANLNDRKSNQTPPSSNDYFPDKTWRTSAPANQGLDTVALNLIVDSLENKGSILIVKNGYNVLEHYTSKYPKSYFHNMHSFTKSITSTMIGIAIYEGYIKSIDEHVVDFFPDLIPDKNDSLKKLITIKHLLTMSSGLEWAENVGGEDVKILQSNTVDWIPFILKKKMIYHPGEHFNYNSGGSHILSAIVSSATKISTSEYAKKRLFDPIGIDSVNWIRKSPEGTTTGGWGSYLRLTDMARIGYMFLHKGKWNSEQIVPEEWVNEATTKKIEVQSEDDDYGYQCWIINDFPKAAYALRGWYLPHYAYVIVVPDENLLIAVAGEVDYYKAKRLIKRYVYNIQ